MLVGIAASFPAVSVRERAQPGSHIHPLKFAFLFLDRFIRNIKQRSKSKDKKMLLKNPT